MLKLANWLTLLSLAGLTRFNLKLDSDWGSGKALGLAFSLFVMMGTGITNCSGWYWWLLVFAKVLVGVSGQYPLVLLAVLVVPGISKRTDQWVLVGRSTHWATLRFITSPLLTGGSPGRR